MAEFTLQFICPDRIGVLAAITQLLARADANVREAAQFGDPETGLFFVRMLVRLEQQKTSGQLLESLAPAIDEFELQVECSDLARKPRVMIAVSQHGHCLQQLLHGWRQGSLHADITSIVSNHDTHADLAKWYGIPFHYLPIRDGNKSAQESAILELIDAERVDLLVLARYMQILSTDTCNRLRGRCINIHHSFLPGFKGAKPYHQAHARGVKLIGATAHYVTSDLDEGPIIEQDVRRVTHATSTDEMVEIGRETEASVLLRAVKWHTEHRVVLNGHKTVVFG
jgi:formyltetrahydrofolate deformylase